MKCIPCPTNPTAPSSGWPSGGPLRPQGKRVAQASRLQTHKGPPLPPGKRRGENAHPFACELRSGTLVACTRACSLTPIRPRRTQPSRRRPIRGRVCLRCRCEIAARCGSGWAKRDSRFRRGVFEHCQQGAGKVTLRVLQLRAAVVHICTSPNRQRLIATWAQIVPRYDPRQRQRKEKTT
jgi:hypothetical protein